MALIAVTAILAVSNLGTSFAAMFLAKEMSADTDTGAMRVASTGEIAAVQTSGETYELTDLTAEQYQERRALVLSEMEEDPPSSSSCQKQQGQQEMQLQKPRSTLQR